MWNELKKEVIYYIHIYESKYKVNTFQVYEMVCEEFTSRKRRQAKTIKCNITSQIALFVRSLIIIYIIATFFMVVNCTCCRIFNNLFVNWNPNWCGSWCRLLTARVQHHSTATAATALANTATTATYNRKKVPVSAWYHSHTWGHRCWWWSVANMCWWRKSAHNQCHVATWRCTGSIVAAAHATCHMPTAWVREYLQKCCW